MRQIGSEGHVYGMRIVNWYEEKSVAVLSCPSEAVVAASSQDREEHRESGGRTHTGGPLISLKGQGQVQCVGRRFIRIRLEDKDSCRTAP